jgi:hypothetical protein
MTVLRWLLLLPGALLGAVIGGALFKFVNTITGQADSWLFGSLIDLAGSWITGALAVALAMTIAPSHRPRVGLVAGAVVLVLAGCLLFPALMMRRWFSAVSCVVLAVGAGSVAYSVANGELTGDEPLA